MDINTSYQFLSRLPLLYGKISDRDYKFLTYKWGGIDKEWHSIKNAIKNTDTPVSIDEARNIETSSVKKIEEIITKIFSCAGCGYDLRKTGLNHMTTGYQESHSYLAEDGKINRTNNERFLRDNFPDKERDSYSCLGCSHDVLKDSATLLFIRNGINSSSTREYMKKFEKVVIDIPITKTEKQLQRDMGFNSFYNGRTYGNGDSDSDLESIVFPT